MADDIFLSPEEQDERAKKWLKDNGLAIGVGIALGFGAIFGYNQYKASNQSNAENASSLFSTALTAFNASDRADIDAPLAELKEKHKDSTYASKVVLMKAAQLSNTDLDGAYTQLQWVVDNAPEVGLVHTARIRQIKIAIANGKLDEAKALATQASYDGFESHYQEQLADIAVAQGDDETASTHYQAAIEALNTGDAAYGRVLGLKLDRLAVVKNAE